MKRRECHVFQSLDLFDDSKEFTLGPWIGFEGQSLDIGRLARHQCSCRWDERCTGLEANRSVQGNNKDG